MSTRRQRIKPSANLALASKRKSKAVTAVSDPTVVSSNESNNVIPAKQNTEAVSDTPQSNGNSEETPKDHTEKQTDTNVISNKPGVVESISGHLADSQVSFYKELKRENDTIDVTEIQASIKIQTEDEFSLDGVAPSQGITTQNQEHHVSDITVGFQVSVDTSVDEGGTAKQTSKTVESGGPTDTTSEQTRSESPSKSYEHRLASFEDTFKYPQNPEYKRPLSMVSADDNADFEDSILQMDLQRSPGFPMSPTRSRQRIRPTPIFGQRRNSLVAGSPSPHVEDDTANVVRQRSSNSTSSDIQNSFAMRKSITSNLSRIRTESSCSTMSESRQATRKATNDEQRTRKREYKHRFKCKTPDKSSLKMFDLIYYNPATNPMSQNPLGRPESFADQDDPIESVAEEPIKSTDAMPVPQLKLGLNGEMMIDEKSLEIETTAEAEARKVLANTSIVYHDENTGGSGFFKKPKRTKEWTAEETIKFYRCLQAIGTDFSLMLTLFPKRTRFELKAKFKREERFNLSLINKALLYPGTFNIEELKEQIEAEEQEKAEQERLWKEIKAKEPTPIKKARNFKSAASRVLAVGEGIYKNEHITTEKLSRRNLSKVRENTEKRKRGRPRKYPLPVEKDAEKSDSADLVNDPVDDSVLENADGSEMSITQIFTELENGTLAFVTSEDPNDPDKAIDEIYILCKETGELSDKPLDLPPDLVESIRTAITS